MVFRIIKQSRMKMKTSLPVGSTIPVNQLVIRLPDYRVLKVIAKSILFIFAIATFPWLGSFYGVLTSDEDPFFGGSADVPPMLVPVIYRDLINEGLIQSCDSALFIQNENIFYSREILTNYGFDLISGSDVERQSLIPGSTYDLVFISGAFKDSKFIDRALKNNGLLVIQLSKDVSEAFRKPENYRIAYLRKFESTVVAMRKLGNSPGKRHLFAFESEAKRAALDGLEDVLLEPPRGSSMHNNYLKKTRYLPDLLGDSLDEYPRRVFIDVCSQGKKGTSMNWFKRHYPTRNQVFEMYKVEMVTEESSVMTEEYSSLELGVSDWLRKNVREEEYVVMKAEAEAVEEMISSKAISLVDELFLECKYQWQRKNKSRRAYWQCLALYGRLRDEGIAVHQWWGYLN